MLLHVVYNLVVLSKICIVQWKSRTVLIKPFQTRCEFQSAKLLQFIFYGVKYYVLEML